MQRRAWRVGRLADDHRLLGAGVWHQRRALLHRGIPGPTLNAESRVVVVLYPRLTYSSYQRDTPLNLNAHRHKTPFSAEQSQD